MSRAERLSVLLRAVVLAYQNGKNKVFARRGWEKPKSMYVLRRQQIRLATTYAIPYEPFRSRLFLRNLPCEKNWPGARQLIPPQT